MTNNPVFSEGFENGLGAWDKEIAKSSNLEIVSSPSRVGRKSLKVTLWPGDIAANKNRAEIRTPNPLLDEGWYAWSFFIPKDYKDTTNPDLFQIIGQFIDEPMGNLTWDDIYASASINYGIKNGEFGIGISYGVQGKSRGIIGGAPIAKGKWYDLMLHIKWSQGQDGFIESWLNGAALANSNGPNRYCDGPQRFKLGLYRSMDFTTVNSIFYDRIRIGKTRNSVE